MQVSAEWLAPALTVLAGSNNAKDYCRRVTLDTQLGKGVVGTHLFALASTGRFHKIGSYGLYPFPDDLVFNQFEDNILSQTINRRRHVRENSPEGAKMIDLLASPAIKGDVPNGVLLSICSHGQGGDIEFETPDFSLTAFHNALGMFVAATGFNTVENTMDTAQNNALTERQFEILLGIVKGKTNLAISKEMMLSESSIKQETVKIFRSLGVSSRQQAAAKAKALGMVPEGSELIG